MLRSAMDAEEAPSEESSTPVQPVSVAQRVREADRNRVAAAEERFHRLSFQGPCGDFITKEFEDTWEVEAMLDLWRL